jgi:hypothetical protein
MATQQGSHEANTQIAAMMDSTASAVGGLANGVLDTADTLYAGFKGVDGEAYKSLLTNWVEMVKQIQSGMESIQRTMLTNDGQSITNQLDNITQIRSDSTFDILSGN